MTILAKRSITKEDKSNIITLGAIAKEMKVKDPEVINATIGMLYDEKGSLFTFKSVDEALSLLTPDEKYAYSSTPGSNQFHEALKHWVFQDYYDLFNNEETHSAVMATPGGSGAISNTFSNYLNENDKVLLPNYMWGNYKQFAYENNQGYITYSMFDKDGNFNLADIKEKMLALKESQHRILLVVNDPCQNPTGYSMSNDEWKMLIDIINEISKDNTPVVLLHDMAYIDYDYRGLKATRDNMLLYKTLNDSAMVILAFSGSKTLALYGVRIGAQIAISNNVENIEDFKRANKFSSRSKWSNTTNLGQNIIVKIMNDDVLKNAFKNELEESRQTLLLRANTFLTEADKVGLKTIPFKCGFFITIPCSNPNLVYEKLKERKVHVIPMDGFIRVTIASIRVQDCKVLPRMIKECLE